MSLIFEWDEHKARQNIQNHGVSFEEAATVVCVNRKWTHLFIENRPTLDDLRNL